MSSWISLSELTPFLIAWASMNTIWYIFIFAVVLILLSLYHGIAMYDFIIHVVVVTMVCIINFVIYMTPIIYVLAFLSLVFNSMGYFSWGLCRLDKSNLGKPTVDETVEKNDGDIND